jgi:hypothetical protein
MVGAERKWHVVHERQRRKAGYDDKARSETDHSDFLRRGRFEMGSELMEGTDRLRKPKQKERFLAKNGKSAEPRALGIYTAGFVEFPLMHLSTCR